MGRGLRTVSDLYTQYDKGTGCNHQMSTPAELSVIHEDFDTLDTDGSGFIQGAELSKLLEAQFGHEPTQAQLAKALAQFDLNEDGQISFDEYVCWLYPKDADLSSAMAASAMLLAKAYVAGLAAKDLPAIKELSALRWSKDVFDSFVAEDAAGGTDRRFRTERNPNPDGEIARKGGRVFEPRFLENFEKHHNEILESCDAAGLDWSTAEITQISFPTSGHCGDFDVYMTVSGQKVQLSLDDSFDVAEGPQPMVLFSAKHKLRMGERVRGPKEPNERIQVW